MAVFQDALAKPPEVDVTESEVQENAEMGEIERFERIEEFFKACNEVFYFDEPRRIRIKANTTVIGKSIRVLNIHGNQKYVDVVVDELDLGLNDKISYKSNTYNRVVIKTLFGFDLTTKVSLKLLSNDL